MLLTVVIVLFSSYVIRLVLFHGKGHDDVFKHDNNLKKNIYDMSTMYNRKNFIKQSEFIKAIIFGINGEFPPFTDRKDIRVLGRSEDGKHFNYSYRDWRGQRYMRIWKNKSKYE
jgi:hypothetical protein